MTRDTILSVIALGSCIFSITWTFRYWIKRIKTDTRSFDDCINDIRAMNTYNSYFLAAIIVFFGFTVNKSVVLPKSSLIMLLAAFIFAAFSIFFIPLRKSAADSGAASAKALWLYTLLLSQLVVILCVFGIVNVILLKIS